MIALEGAEHGVTPMELLALLARDAPARDAALAIRAAIDGHRRRESDLAALVEIARDLASLADPGGVLDTIVRRAAPCSARTSRT